MADRICPECSGDLPENEGKYCRHCGRPLESPAAQTNGAAQKVPQDILDWARGQFNEEEFVAGLREIRETGGLELKDFIHELEQEAAPRE